MKKVFLLFLLFALPVQAQWDSHSISIVSGAVTIDAGTANPSFTINGTTAPVLRYTIAGVRKWSTYTDGTNSFTWDYNGTTMMNLSSTAGLTIGSATATGNPALNISSQTAPVLRFTRAGSRLWDIYSDGTFGLTFLYTGTSVRLAINSAGDFGIGTASPVGKFHVEDVDTALIDFDVDVSHANATQADTSTIRITKDGSNDPSILVADSKGNITYYGTKPYGTMGFADSSITISMDQNSYYHVTNASNTLFSAGVVSNVTVLGDSMTANSAGNYSISYDLSFSGNATDVYHVSIFVNGVEQAGKGETQRGISASDLGVTSGSTILTLAAGDGVRLFIKNTVNGNDATIAAGNLTIVKN